MRNIKSVSFNKEIRVSINNDILRSIYAECDKYDRDETGGRVLGFIKDSPRRISLDICALIEPGLAAQRTRTSFFQDGDHQERVFREIEKTHPEIEHLGNWHTHHVNGLETLSGGDIDTYTKTVNHRNHNIDYFYALLVTSKNGTRYDIRHFLFRRNDQNVYEIPDAYVITSNRQSIYLPGLTLPSCPSSEVKQDDKARQVRINDNLHMPQLFPTLKPFLSKQTKSVYWRGRLELVDNSRIEVLVLENVQDNNAEMYYSAAIAKADAGRFDCSNRIREIKYGSAIEALLAVERTCNREIFSFAK